MKKALITGITGQDGSYLAEFLLSKHYEVHGIVRRSSSINRERIDHISGDEHNSSTHLFLHYGDIADSEQISNLIYNVKPDEVYNLAAQSHVRVSFDLPEYTGNITALGVTRLLDIIRRSGNKTRIYQASSSEMFGKSPPPQNEESPLQPRSPYACAKVYSYWMARNYRDGYSVPIWNGILFNHESPRRGETFVTRKISRSIARIIAKKSKYLYLGNLEAKRDWGFAPEYVECMWKMLQSESASDYVIGTGEAHSVKEFLQQAFAYARLDINEHVKIDPAYFRPTEPETLIADNTRAKAKLGWTHKITFDELVKIMVDADLRKEGLAPIGEGDQIIKDKFPDRWWKID